MPDNLENLLIPGLAEFLRENPDAMICSYYHRPFNQFEEHLLKKCSVKSDVEPLLQVTPKSSTVVEIGAGAGRVSLPLAKSCSYVHAI